MELNLSPKFAQKIFEGEGGTYYSWSSSEYELLKEAKVGGGRLVLQPRGFAFPHYSDLIKLVMFFKVCPNKLFISNALLSCYPLLS